jgi:hypothetical protein
MQIFEQEKADGLEPILNSTASISYASVAQPYHGTKKDVKYLKSIASFTDEDLYYVQSILVSSSWNKNDDIFDKLEVWNARNTPEHKPTNLEHNEETIIGHIISNWPITEDGILIDENTPEDNLPEKYHILTGSVIYRGFSNPELRERSNKLISEIEDGTKYVSMECFFKGFDYGILNKSTGEYKILNRNNETAYLTKHLRSYGGLGEHENYKIGRVLRNITFTGKGYVDKPANTDSIIFSKNMIIKPETETKVDNFEEKNEEIVNSGVLSFQSNTNSEILTMIAAKEEVVMENTEAKTECAEATEKAITLASEMSTQVSELKTANEKLQAELSEAIAAKDSEIAQLREQAAQVLAQEIEKLQIEMLAEAAKKMEDEKKAKDEEMTKVKSELDAANEVIAGYKMKEEEMAKKEKKMKRVASLIEAGFDNESASATVDKFESLNDEAFEAMTSLFAGKMPPWLNKKDEKKDEKEMKAKPKASSDNADTQVLEQAEEDESVNLSVGGEPESAVDSTRAALVEFVCSKLGKKNNK